jgi:uncharacterized protein
VKIGLSTMLSQETKRELLRIARGAIEAALRHSSAAMPTSVNEQLLQPCGAFVTLRISHELRGCIGYIESLRPLNEVVAEVAPKAALEDPRFPPLSLAELEHVTIEISVLSPLWPISRIEEIEVGVHGLLLELGLNRGLLLPQVATEYHWDRLAFLNATARKAGLLDYAWREPEAKIYIFTADIIEEEQLMQEET